MKFDITYRARLNPIKKVKFISAGGADCQIFFDNVRDIVLEIDDGYASFSPQSAIDLGEMLIKLGKQELEDNTNGWVYKISNHTSTIHSRAIYRHNFVFRYSKHNKYQIQVSWGMGGKTEATA